MDLNTALFFSALAISAASPDSSADKAVLNAYLKQSGIERNAKRFEKRHVPKRVRMYLGYAAFVVKTVSDQQITMRWSF